MRRKLVALALLLLASPGQAVAGGELYVLAINGGGDRLDNFASHLAHLRQLVELLVKAGVPGDHVTVLASDGRNPAPDLATREPDPENAWLLQGTQVDPGLRDLLTFESSVLPGVELRPATQAGLARAIAELRRRLRPSDTLLLYVTDHGTQSRRDPIDNRITLWGPRESISVRQMGAMLASLPSQLRVVSLMSQCYSGGFAYLHEARERSRVPGGATCGYFSSTPDRPAYGCYPEVRGQKAVGHSFEFLSALTRHGRFPAAHNEILWSDDTPDIPLRSSDVYLAELLSRNFSHDKGAAGLLDSLVRKAFEGGAGAAESRLLDRIASLHGVPRPTTLAELDDSVERLFDFLDEISAHTKVWETALGDFNRSSLDAFLATHPAWRERISYQAVARLAPAARRERATALLAELFPFVASDGARLVSANRLLTGLLDADEIGYRTEIRVAALLRMRFVLTSLAGREWIKQRPKEYRSKPAVPIGGKYRLIDIPISNCLHSNIKDIYVLTQFNSESLNNHINNTYRFDYFSRAFVRILAAEQTVDNTNWFQGTADAVRRNIFHLDLHGDETILILSGDHLYDMDYRKLIGFHNSRGGDFTVSVIPIKPSEASEFGVLKLNAHDRIIGFKEKPKTAAELQGYRFKGGIHGIRPLKGANCLASMGVYVFNAKTLIKVLGGNDADFGKEIIPHSIKHFKGVGFVYDGYWRDIGTIRSFYDVSMSLAMSKQCMSFFYEGDVFTRPRFLPTARISRCKVEHSLIAEGSVVSDAEIDNSIVGLRSIVGKGCKISKTVLMGADYYETAGSLAHVKIGIGDGSEIHKAIVDKNARIGKNVIIRNFKGLRDYNGDNYFIRDGIVIVPKNATIKNGARI